MVVAARISSTIFNPWRGHYLRDPINPFRNPVLKWWKNPKKKQRQGKQEILKKYRGNQIDLLKRIIMDNIDLYTNYNLGGLTKSMVDISSSDISRCHCKNSYVTV